jgi:hypothetical protein
MFLFLFKHILIAMYIPRLLHSVCMYVFTYILNFQPWSSMYICMYICSDQFIAKRHLLNTTYLLPNICQKRKKCLTDFLAPRGLKD